MINDDFNFFSNQTTNKMISSFPIPLISDEDTLTSRARRKGTEELSIN
jgi:hypothetical protein